jgi:hypothetical protein
MDGEASMHVTHGQGIIIEFNGGTIRLGADSKWELEEPLRVVKAVDGRTVESSSGPEPKWRTRRECLGISGWLTSSTG